MGRPKRPNIPGGLYHVLNRGNRKAPIFEDDRDRRRFLSILTEEQEVYGVKNMGLTLMHNHFHAGVLTPNGNLSEFMEQVEGRFARYSNWRHHRVGHLFQGRFRHVHIENDIHLLTALCYILLNPVTARLVAKLEDYKWSSYSAIVGLSSCPSYLSIEWLDALFPMLSREDAQLRFKQIMDNADPVAAYIGDVELNVSTDTVRRVIRSYSGEQLSVARLPRLYRTALRPSLQQLIADGGGDVDRLVVEARVVFGYRTVEIAKALKITPGAVSKLFCKARRKRQRQTLNEFP